MHMILLQKLLLLQKNEAYVLILVISIDIDLPEITQKRSFQNFQIGDNNT